MAMALLYCKRFSYLFFAECYIFLLYHRTRGNPDFIFHKQIFVLGVYIHDKYVHDKSIIFAHLDINDVGYLEL